MFIEQSMGSSIPNDDGVAERNLEPEQSAVTAQRWSSWQRSKDERAESRVFPSGSGELQRVAGAYHIPFSKNMHS